MTGFGGFPPQTTRLLMQLRANNHKGWLEAHRADDEAYWLAPTKAFVLAAGELLARLVPGIRAEPQGARLDLPHQLRHCFTRDPRLYKDHIDFWFWEGARRRAVSGLSPGSPLRSSASAPAATASTRSGCAGSGGRSPRPAGGAELAGVAARWRPPAISWVGPRSSGRPPGSRAVARPGGSCSAGHCSSTATSPPTTGLTPANPGCLRAALACVGAT
jgi:hypothetical protein